MLEDFIFGKHFLLLIFISPASFFFLQSYVAFPICLAWHLWGWKLFRTDLHLVYLINFQVINHKKFKESNADLIHAATAIQEPTSQKLSRGEYLALYEKKRKIAADFNLESRLNYQPKRTTFYCPIVRASVQWVLSACIDLKDRTVLDI